MRKLIFENLITLDGYFEGPNKEIDWHNVDAEFNEYAISFLNSVDHLIFGRVTYELMSSYWPTQQALTDDQIIAEKMNNLNKIVISRTLKKAEWNNTRLMKDNFVEEIQKLKQQSGKNMVVFGSSDLAITLIENKLIDEFHILVNPILLGKGKTLLRGITNRINLKLIEAKTFKNGNVMLYYRI